ITYRGNYTNNAPVKEEIFEEVIDHDIDCDAIYKDAVNKTDDGWQRTIEKVDLRKDVDGVGICDDVKQEQTSDYGEIIYCDELEDDDEEESEYVYL
ncbi:hypothetical protein SK128_023927, partial [Halocaridina rubra]